LKLQDNIGLVSWTAFDKVTYILYGVISLLQMKYLEPDNLGLFALLINLHTWIFIISDSLALQNIIQFGVEHENRKIVNLYSLILLIILTLGSSFLFYLFRYPLSGLFDEARIVDVAEYLTILVLLTIPRMYCLKFLFRDHRMSGVFAVNASFFGVMIALTIYYILAFKELNFMDMIVIYFSGTIISSIHSLIITRKEFILGFVGKVKFKEMLRFSFPLMFSATVYSLPKQLDIFVIQYFFSTSSVGIYYSAKNLFRFFDEAISAAQSLVYPAAVRHIRRNNLDQLSDLYTKAISFIFIAFIAVAFILEFGLSEFLIKLFLPAKYNLSIDHFNLMLFATPFLPFLIFSSVINAFGNPKVLLKIVNISTLCSFIVLFFVGLSKNDFLIPLGLMTNYFVFAVISYYWANREIGYKFKQIFRAVGDSYYFLTKKKKS